MLRRDHEKAGKTKGLRIRGRGAGMPSTQEGKGLQLLQPEGESGIQGEDWRKMKESNSNQRTVESLYVAQYKPAKDGKKPLKLQGPEW